MALNNIAKFQWDKVLTKVESADAKRALNSLRAKANEIVAASAKYGATAEKIDFDGYKKKLRFTSAAVDTLQSAYKNRTLPSFHATLPAFEAKKRELTLKVVSQIANAAQEDLASLEQQLVELEKLKITKETTYGEISARFPKLAREIEQEIKNHEWNK